jgi:hypothetical protein
MENFNEYLKIIFEVRKNVGLNDNCKTRNFKEWKRIYKNDADILYCWIFYKDYEADEFKNEYQTDLVEFYNDKLN